MQTKQLGNSDLHITPIGFGAWAIGSSGWSFAWGSQDDDESIKAIRRAIDLGINWIDTAAVYGLGHSEEVVARALKGISNRPYVFTKCSQVWDDKREVRTILKADSLRKEVEDSLRRLQVDVIDLYQIHWPNADIEEGWTTLTELQQQGKVKYIGVSNFKQGSFDKKVKDINPLKLVHSQTLHFEQVSILHTCIYPTYFSEHSDSSLKIAIPLQSASIQATWQTATGRQKQQWIKPGNVSIIPAHQPREIIWHKRAGILSIYLEPGLIGQIAEELKLGAVEIVEQRTARDAFIQQLGMALQTELESGSANSLYVESMANVLAVHVLRRYSSSDKPVHSSTQVLCQPKLKHAIDYIHSHLEQDITLNTLAEFVQMSPYYFARAFKQATGHSPHQYLLACRIERAKTLLTQSELSIADISHQLGFSSQSHFTTMFRRFMAVTPKVYREAL